GLNTIQAVEGTVFLVFSDHRIGVIVAFGTNEPRFHFTNDLRLLFGIADALVELAAFARPIGNELADTGARRVVAVFVLGDVEPFRARLFDHSKDFGRPAPI